MLVVAIALGLVVPGVASPASETNQAATPPSRLTQYGLEVWELDALLRHTFGKQVVSLEGVRASDNFTTKFVPVAGGGQYTYTFADTSKSTSKLMRIKRSPKTFYNRTYGYTQPLTVNGAYISCGRQRWLYRDYAIGSANAWIACLAPPSTAPVRFISPLSGAPLSGLTAYGHGLWEFEALLHDTFGTRPVYQGDGPPETSDFTARHATTTQGHKSTYTYTFANAAHSTFRLMRPRHPPQANIGATTGSYPITIEGAYISCGVRLWLYETDGDPNINDFAVCETSLPREA